MHRARFFCSSVFALLLVTQVAARDPKPAYQQFLARMDCPKPDPPALSASAVRCMYSSGEIAGEAIQREDDMFASDMYRGTSEGVSSALAVGGDPGKVARLGRGRDRYSGTGVITLANGDTVKIQFRGTTMFEDEDRPSKGQGTWTFTGGAGKAKGIKGSGHYTGRFESDGSASWLVTGRYALSGAH